MCWGCRRGEKRWLLGLIQSLPKVEDFAAAPLRCFPLGSLSTCPLLPWFITALSTGGVLLVAVVYACTCVSHRISWRCILTTTVKGITCRGFVCFVLRLRLFAWRAISLSCLFLSFSRSSANFGALWCVVCSGVSSWWVCSCSL